MDYSPNPVSTIYGKGIEVRVVGGELEFRLADRFPAYSIQVRSQGADVKPGSGVISPSSMRALPDRTERACRHPGCACSPMAANCRCASSRTISPCPKLRTRSHRSRISASVGTNLQGSPRYTGLFDEIAIWTQALTPVEINGLFESRPFPMPWRGASWTGFGDRERLAAGRAPDPYGRKAGRRNRKVGRACAPNGWLCGAAFPPSW